LTKYQLRVLITQHNRLKLNNEMQYSTLAVLDSILQARDKLYTATD